MMSWRTSATTEEFAASSAASVPRQPQNENDQDEPHRLSDENASKDATRNTDSRSSRTNSKKRALEQEEYLEENSQGKKNTDPPDPPGNSSTLTSGNTERETDEEDGADHAVEEEETQIPWKPQTVQSTCEFTHTILDYSQKRESGCKKAEYSTVVSDELGNRWRLIIYVNGNGRASNHHLSLFLQVADAEELPFGWKKAVSYVLTLEHPSGDTTLHYAKRNPDKTFKLCPKAIDWGWSQFITSDRIRQEGFVKADTLTVRAQVTVKSSSVSIDEEDSELYLKCAVEEGDAKAVQLCLDQGASVNCQFKDDLYTPLHTACSSGSTAGSMEVLNLLLANDADCNSCNKWKESPLLIAANNGHRAAVEGLLKHGANPSLCSEAGWSALTFAAHKGFDDIVRLLLYAGAPVNSPVTEDSSTPLHKACAGSKPGHLAAVKLLLEHGADVHALNKWRETPLLTAANHGQAGAVEALLDHDADPCKCTDTGWSPLSIAAYKGHDKVVRLLLEEGAPTEEDDPTLSALLQAATKGLTDTVELLLQNGADHTVTTKKGDTALSILVEQNLIDAAVDMVIKYNASIPRCSRDRKKVQHARLLTNLRMKQLERDGKGTLSTDEDESDGDDSTEANDAQDNENDDTSGDSGEKKARAKVSAEEKARAAEEALLLELEQEDAQAKREEAKANSKQAKKKKKKERDRQQKLKEEDARRQQEAREAKERERLKKEKEERRRKEREEREKVQREKELREMLEVEKAMAAKRKEREAREKREQAQKQRQRESGAASPAGSSSSEGKAKKVAPKKHATDPTPSRKIVSPKSSKQPIVPLGANRRWETTGKTKSPTNVGAQSSTEALHQALGPAMPLSARKNDSSSVDSDNSILLSPRVSRRNGDSSAADMFIQTSSPVTPSPTSIRQRNGSHQAQYAVTPEHPAIVLFRQEKVVELLQRCNQALTLVSELTVKRVIYRWILRASHGTSPYSDPIVPSWTDSDELVAYFQRQFIAESRRPSGIAVSGPSMESLKEAGSWVASLSSNLANQVLEFRHHIHDQLPPDWDDASLGMTVSESDSIVSVSWANRSKTWLPLSTFATLRDRHVGSPRRFLTALFVTKIWYDTTQLIVATTDLGFHLTPETRLVLATEAEVSVELWSDPFSALKSSVFWGQFEQVDGLFGGQKQFGKAELGSEEVFARLGGSLSAMLPADAMVASQYVQRMVDILDAASSSGVPVSFAVFISSECFLDHGHVSSGNDLASLDLRLRDRRGGYVSRVEILQPGDHAFVEGQRNDKRLVCNSTSLFVLLQNGTGKSRYEVNDDGAARIVATLSAGIPNNALAVQPSICFTPSARDSPVVSQRSGLFEELDPVSPDIQLADFGAFGGSSLSSPFSPSNESFPRGPRRGRLFDLVDDGDEELQQADDIVSGMLNNLDVGLFQNASVGADNVDIEAFSLMGIGGHPSRSMSGPGNHAGISRLG